MGRDETAGNADSSNEKDVAVVGVAGREVVAARLVLRAESTSCAMVTGLLVSTIGTATDTAAGVTGAPTLSGLPRTAEEEALEAITCVQS